MQDQQKAEVFEKILLFIPHYQKLNRPNFEIIDMFESVVAKIHKVIVKEFENGNLS